MNGAQIQLKDDQKLLKQDAGGNWVFWWNRWFSFQVSL
jgi:hypothetical protein